MIKIRVTERTGLVNSLIGIIELPCVPREGDYLSLNPGESSYIIHYVKWNSRPDHEGVIVDLYIK
jgi:tRNA C32,U32 (ribose-2'-O)-methylase TrmJ